MAQDEFTPITCMDVRGCRKNALLTRKYLPVGCPMDTLVPVFDDAGQYGLPLKRFAWLWVDASHNQGQHALYDGPHLYPRETVQVLMHEGFLVASADTLPFGWGPKRKFASADLGNAWKQLQLCCGDDPEQEGDAGPCLSKSMILATIGLWSVQERLAWTVRRTAHDADMRGPVRLTRFCPDGTTLKMCSTRLHSDRTMLPVALLRKRKKRKMNTKTF